MENSTTSDIERQGKLIVKMTSKEKLNLNNVLHVIKIHKNLVSRSLLNKYRFRMVVELNIAVLSKNGMYVGKEYISNRLFKLNVSVEKPKNNIAISIFLNFLIYHMVD